MCVFDPRFPGAHWHIFSHLPRIHSHSTWDSSFQPRPFHDSLTARPFLRSDRIFYLHYEICQNQKTPNISNRRDRFSLFCSVLSTSWANKIQREVWIRVLSKSGKKDNVPRGALFSPQLPQCSQGGVTVLQAKNDEEKMRI